MGNVITLVRRAAATAKTACGPHFYCMKCNSETFRLYESGAIHCERCGAKMRNLAAVMEKVPA